MVFSEGPGPGALAGTMEQTGPGGDSRARHDLNNQLTIALGNNRWVADQLPADDPHREALIDAIEALEAAMALLERWPRNS